MFMQRSYEPSHQDLHSLQVLSICNRKITPCLKNGLVWIQFCLNVRIGDSIVRPSIMTNYTIQTLFTKPPHNSHYIIILPNLSFIETSVNPQRNLRINQSACLSLSFEQRFITSGPGIGDANYREYRLLLSDWSYLITFNHTWFLRPLTVIMFD